jgi:hypothetical protein
VKVIAPILQKDREKKRFLNPKQYFEEKEFHATCGTKNSLTLFFNSQRHSPAVDLSTPSMQIERRAKLSLFILKKVLHCSLNNHGISLPYANEGKELGPSTALQFV